MTMNPEPLEFLTEQHWAAIRECFGNDVDKTIGSRSRWESLVQKLPEASEIVQLRYEVTDLRSKFDYVSEELSKADKKIEELEQGESK